TIFRPPATPTLFPYTTLFRSSANVDSCARLCHAASAAGLKQTLGWGAPTCSLSDMIGTDLLVLIGTDLANNQPVTTKYMHFAKRSEEHTSELQSRVDLVCRLL